MKKIGSLTFAAVLAVVACNDVAIPTTSTAALSTTSSDRTAGSTLPPVVDCPGAGEFSEGGGIANAEEEASDATALGQLSWEATDQCESFLLEFVTNEGAPATTVPTVRVDHLESFQVLRVRLDRSKRSPGHPRDNGRRHLELAGAQASCLPPSTS